MYKKILFSGLIFLILFAAPGTMLLPLSSISDGTASASSDHNLYVVITIDTEGANGLNPLENLIWGRIDNTGNEYGISLMMDMCDKYGFKATFFVDVYEYRIHGSEAMKEVCTYINDRGHDVQLHTHPAMPFDPSNAPRIEKDTYNYDSHQWDKIIMSDYQLEEQTAIINEGKELLAQWIGQEPVAHRAGRWGANYDTLDALLENHILVDSSMQFEWPECDLNNPVLTHNKVVERDGVIEIPTSVFKRTSYLKIGPLEFKTSEGQSLLGVSTRLDLMEGALTEYKNHDVRTAVILLHSWSFLNYNENYQEFSVNREAIEKFDELFAFIEDDPEIKVITMKEFYDLYLADPEVFQGNDYIPEVSCYDSYWQKLRWAVASAPESVSADIFIGANVLFVATVLIAVIYIVKRRTAK